MRSSCLTASAFDGAVGEEEVVQVEAALHVLQPARDRTPPSTGSGGSGRAQVSPRWSVCDLLLVLPQEVRSPGFGAERDLERLVAARKALGLRRWSSMPRNADVDREHRRERDHEHSRDQRDAALARARASNGPRIIRPPRPRAQRAPVLEIERDFDGCGPRAPRLGLPPGCGQRSTHFGWRP